MNKKNYFLKTSDRSFLERLPALLLLLIMPLELAAPAIAAAAEPSTQPSTPETEVANFLPVPIPPKLTIAADMQQFRKQLTGDDKTLGMISEVSTASIPAAEREALEKAGKSLPKVDFKEYTLDSKEIISVQDRAKAMRDHVERIVNNPKIDQKVRFAVLDAYISNVVLPLRDLLVTVGDYPKTQEPGYFSSNRESSWKPRPDPLTPFLLTFPEDLTPQGSAEEAWIKGHYDDKDAFQTKKLQEKFAGCQKKPPTDPCHAEMAMLEAQLKLAETPDGKARQATQAEPPLLIRHMGQDQQDKKDAQGNACVAQSQLQFNGLYILGRDLRTLVEAPSQTHYLDAMKKITLQLILSQITTFSSLAGDNNPVSTPVACRNRLGGLPDAIPIPPTSDRDRQMRIDQLLQNNGLHLAEDGAYRNYYLDTVKASPERGGFSGYHTFEREKTARRALGLFNDSTHWPSENFLVYKSGFSVVDQNGNSSELAQRENPGIDDDADFGNVMEIMKPELFQALHLKPEQYKAASEKADRQAQKVGRALQTRIDPTQAKEELAKAAANGEQLSAPSDLPQAPPVSDEDPAIKQIQELIKKQQQESEKPVKPVIKAPSVAACKTGTCIQQLMPLANKSSTTQPATQPATPEDNTPKTAEERILQITTTDPVTHSSVLLLNRIPGHDIQKWYSAVPAQVKKDLRATTVHIKMPPLDSPDSYRRYALGDLSAFTEAISDKFRTNKIADDDKFGSPEELQIRKEKREQARKRKSIASETGRPNYESDGFDDDDDQDMGGGIIGALRRACQPSRFEGTHTQKQDPQMARVCSAGPENFLVFINEKLKQFRDPNQFLPKTAFEDAEVRAIYPYLQSLWDELRKLDEIHRKIDENKLVKSGKLQLFNRCRDVFEDYSLEGTLAPAGLEDSCKALIKTLPVPFASLHKLPNASLPEWSFLRSQIGTNPWATVRLGYLIEAAEHSDELEGSNGKLRQAASLLGLDKPLAPMHANRILGDGETKALWTKVMKESDDKNQGLFKLKLGSSDRDLYEMMDTLNQTTVLNEKQQDEAIKKVLGSDPSHLNSETQFSKDIAKARSDSNHETSKLLYELYEARGDQTADKQREIFGKYLAECRKQKLAADPKWEQRPANMAESALKRVDDCSIDAGDAKALLLDQDLRLKRPIINEMIRRAALVKRQEYVQALNDLCKTDPTNVEEFKNIFAMTMVKQDAINEMFGLPTMPEGVKKMLETPSSWYEWINNKKTGIPMLNLPMAVMMGMGMLGIVCTGATGPGCGYVAGMVINGTLVAGQTLMARAALEEMAQAVPRVEQQRFMERLGLSTPEGEKYVEGPGKFDAVQQAFMLLPFTWGFGKSMAQGISATGLNAGSQLARNEAAMLAAKSHASEVAERLLKVETENLVTGIKNNTLKDLEKAAVDESVRDGILKGTITAETLYKEHIPVVRQIALDSAEMRMHVLHSRKNLGLKPIEDMLLEDVGKMISNPKTPEAVRKELVGQMVDRYKTLGNLKQELTVARDKGLNRVGALGRKTSQEERKYFQDKINKVLNSVETAQAKGETLEQFVQGDAIKDLAQTADLLQVATGNGFKTFGRLMANNIRAPVLVHETESQIIDAFAGKIEEEFNGDMHKYIKYLKKYSGKKLFLGNVLGKEELLGFRSPLRGWMGGYEKRAAFNQKISALITDLEAEGKTGTVTMADAIKRHFELNMEVIKDLPMAKREALYMFSIHGNGFWEWQNLEMRNYARSADTMLSQIKQRSLNRLVGLPQIVGKNHVADELLHINAMMQKAAPSYYDVWVKETAFFIGTKAGGVAMGPIETMLRNKSPAVIQIIDKIKPAEWLAPNAPYSEAQMTLMIDKYRHPKNTDELKTLVSLLQIQEGRMRMPKPHAPE